MSTGIALPLQDFVAWGWAVNATPRPLYPRARSGTHCTGGWVGPRAGLDGCGKSHPHRDRSLDRPTRNESLYRLSYSGSQKISDYNLNMIVCSVVLWSEAHARYVRNIIIQTGEPWYSLHSVPLGYSRNITHFMEPPGGYQCAFEPFTCAYREQHQSCPCPHPISWKPILILSSQTRQCSPSGPFSSGVTNKTLYAHISKHVPHAQPISIYGTGLKRRNHIRIANEWHQV